RVESHARIVKAHDEMELPTVAEGLDPGTDGRGDLIGRPGRNQVLQLLVLRRAHPESLPERVRALGPPGVHAEVMAGALPDHLPGVALVPHEGALQLGEPEVVRLLARLSGSVLRPGQRFLRALDVASAPDVAVT